MQYKTCLDWTTLCYKELNHQWYKQWWSPPPLPSHSQLWLTLLSLSLPADLVAIYSSLQQLLLRITFLIKINDLTSILSSEMFHNLNFLTVYSSRPSETWPIVENQGQSVYKGHAHCCNLQIEIWKPHHFLAS